MNFIPSFDPTEMMAAIESELSRIVQEPTRKDYSELYSMLAYHMGWDTKDNPNKSVGKRIRPYLLLLCTSSAGGNWNNALPAAAAVELLHNFSLIHDDIEDNSQLRRGRPSVWYRWGIPQALNAGDAMFTLANLALLEVSKSLSMRNTLRAALVFNRTSLELTRGQYLDISFETRNEVSIEEYWLMVAGKTAALLSACAEIGAISAGANNKTITNYRNFGKQLGLAFQAQDDLLGIWGDAALTGKSTDSDLVTCKKTLPVLFGFQLKKEFYRQWHQQQIRPEDVPSLADLLEEEGGKQFTEEYVKSLTKQALNALELAQPQEPYAQALKALTLQLIERKK